MTLILDPRTTVSGVAELLRLREQIDTLTARLADVASHIADDAAFMGGQVLTLPHFDARDGLTAARGTLYHVGRYEHEFHGVMDENNSAHPIDRCGRTIWCQQRAGERVKVRYTREPNRSWRTFLGQWVLVDLDNTRTGTFVAIKEVTA